MTHSKAVSARRQLSSPGAHQHRAQCPLSAKPGGRSLLLTFLGRVTIWEQIMKSMTLGAFAFASALGACIDTG
jgi:hypothetical protein